MSYTKKLIEVALPLEDINAASAREKSIRHGHPSTLHLWWARRPLAAARAVLFSQLVDDPSGYVDELRNNSKLVKKSESELKKRLKDWRDKKELFDQVQAGGGQGTNPGDEPTLDAILVELERERLFNMIRELVLWENTTNERVLEPAREEIKISWRRTCRREGKPEDTPMPPFLDPFAGGGAIPLEAQRLGLEANASDLNPVAVLINKAMIEIPPKFADMPPVHPKAREELGTTGWKGAGGLAEDVKRYGEWLREEAMRRIGHLYPPYKLTQELIDSRPDLQDQGYKDGDELTVIAWLWSRTVTCMNPACAKEMPLITSYVLSAKKGKECYLKPKIDSGDLKFEISSTPPHELFDFKKGQKRGMSGIFECIFCSTTTTRDYVAKQANDVGLGKIPTAIVAEGARGRIYFEGDSLYHHSSLPDINLSGLNAKLAENPRDVWCRNFGLKTPADLFTDRQLAALTTFCDIIPKLREEVLHHTLDASKENTSLNFSNNEAISNYVDSITTYIGLLIGQIANHSSQICGWNAPNQQMRNTFGRQALPMVWDFAEVGLFSNSSGSINNLIERQAKGFVTLGNNVSEGFVTHANATSRSIHSNTIISTDPPYYDNIGYADLSDFFYVWLRRALSPLNLKEFQTILVPKEEELIAAPYRHGSSTKAENFFLSGMTDFASKIVKVSESGNVVTIYYAFKQAELKEGGSVSVGWASFLEALINSGFLISGTWPVRTEKPGRTIGIGTNALASSIVLVCKSRTSNAQVATRKEFINSLSNDVKSSLSILQQGNIAPVDLPQASIGPGMAIFSSYEKVLEADGTKMSVTTALQLINGVVDEFLSEQEAAMDSWTRFAVTWFSQNKFDEGSFGDAETLATARVVTVDGVQEAGILKSGGGKVRLLKRDELDPNWDPATDTRLTVWEVTHYLIRDLLDGGGEMAAAKLLKKVGGLAEDAKGLAYRLYTICEQNKWAELGRDYNMLVSLWPELVKQAQELESEQSTQSELEI